jgi:type IV secretion system protein VirD4
MPTATLRPGLLDACRPYARLAARRCSEHGVPRRAAGRAGPPPTPLRRLVGEITSELYARATSTGRPLEPPLLVVLDEAASIAPLADLDVLASTGAGQGLQLVTVVQDLAQMRTRWGPKAATIVNNHRAKIIGAGVSDTDTLTYVTRLLGDQELPQVSRTANDYGGHSTTEGSTFRALAPAHVIRQSQPGTGVLIYGTLPPAHLRLRPWFGERKLRQLVESGDA